MSKAKLIPYGIADFACLRENNYYYVDRTHKIPLLEESRFVHFFRPRRFGKSLWLATLQSYYDLAFAHKFDSLFAGTYIHEHPTPEQGKYMILYFNFSMVAKTIEEVESSLNSYCCINFDAFTEKYEQQLSPKTLARIKAAETCYDKLVALGAANQESDGKIYILIDEYDNFTNAIVAEYGTEAYQRICHGDGCFKRFFNILKGCVSQSNSAIQRIFITGVSPVTLDDVTSGYNISENLSLDVAFSDLCGFTMDEVEEMLNYYTEAGVLTVDKVPLLQTISKWYNNYRFGEEGKGSVCNPILCFNYLKKAISSKKMPTILVDENIRMDYGKLQHLVTVDGKLNGNFHAIETLVSNGKLTGHLAQSFQMREITNPDNFLSLMYYYGLLSISRSRGDFQEFICPNACMDMLLNLLIADGYKKAARVDTRMNAIANTMVNFAFNGDWKPCMDLLAKVIRDCISVRDLQEGEKVVQSTMNALLHFCSVYCVHTEYHANGGYADIALVPMFHTFPEIRYTALIELKYIKKSEKATDQAIGTLVEQARKQLAQYVTDGNLQKEWFLVPEGPITLVKLAVVFQGGEMLACQEV